MKLKIRFHLRFDIVNIKSKVKIGSIFVAFLESMNFNHKKYDQAFLPGQRTGKFDV
jgi:hypothetical protein